MTTFGGLLRHASENNQEPLSSPPGSCAAEHSRAGMSEQYALAFYCVVPRLNPLQVRRLRRGSPCLLELEALQALWTEKMLSCLTAEVPAI